MRKGQTADMEDVEYYAKPTREKWWPLSKEWIHDRFGEIK